MHRDIHRYRRIGRQIHGWIQNCEDTVRQSATLLRSEDKQEHQAKRRKHSACHRRTRCRGALSRRQPKISPLGTWWTLQRQCQLHLRRQIRQPLGSHRRRHLSCRRLYSLHIVSGHRRTSWRSAFHLPDSCRPLCRHSARTLYKTRQRLRKGGRHCQCLLEPLSRQAGQAVRINGWRHLHHQRQKYHPTLQQTHYSLMSIGQRQLLRRRDRRSVPYRQDWQPTQGEYHRKSHHFLTHIRRKPLGAQHLRTSVQMHRRLQQAQRDTAQGRRQTG